jgi:hypothetical protein
MGRDRSCGSPSHPRTDAERLAAALRSDPIGNRTARQCFDQNRGMSRTCINCRSISGGSALLGCTASPRPLPPQTTIFRAGMATWWQQHLTLRVPTG